MAIDTTEAAQVEASALDFEVAEADTLADLATATGDPGLTEALRIAAERITCAAEAEAAGLREQARIRRTEAGQTYAAASELLAKTSEEGRLLELAAEEVSDEGLRRHLVGIVAFEDARRAKAVEWLERAQELLEAASQEAKELEARAEGILNYTRARPEVIAWRQLTAQCLDRIERARNARAIDSALHAAERQGLIDERLRQAAVERKRQLGELARRTREAVKLWARYASGTDGLYPSLTLSGTVLLVAAGPGTIFEVSADGRKLAVHLSEDGVVWVRRRAHGRFEARGAMARKVGRPADPRLANTHPHSHTEEACS
jgi:hypothetical protein